MNLKYEPASEPLHISDLARRKDESLERRVSGQAGRRGERESERGERHQVTSHSSVRERDR